MKQMKISIYVCLLELRDHSEYDYVLKLTMRIAEQKLDWFELLKSIISQFQLIVTQN